MKIQDPIKIGAISISLCLAGTAAEAQSIAGLTGKVLASDSAVETAPANIYVANANGAGVPCYLTHDGNVNRNAGWSYDGTKVVWNLSSSLGGIWIMNANGANQKNLTAPSPGAPSWAFGPAFSPDDAKIVYSDYFPAATTSPSNPLVGIELWTMNVDGSGKRRLTNTTENGSTITGEVIRWSNRPSYSPNGKSIVYSSTQSGNSEIWVIAPNGTNQRELTFNSGSNGSRGPDANFPSYSPDGAKIVYLCGWETMYGNICVMNADGYAPTQLTHNADDGLRPNEPSSDEPAWSPDGRSIMFDSNQYDPKLGRAAAETWVMNADGSNQRVMISHMYGEGRNPWIHDPAYVGGPAFQCGGSGPKAKAAAK